MKRQLLLYLIKLFVGIVVIIICWLALTNIFVECGVIIPANYSETILEENRKRLDDIQQINLVRKGKCCFDAYNNKKTFIE